MTWSPSSSPAARSRGTGRRTRSPPNRPTWLRCCPACRCRGRTSRAVRRCPRTARSSPGTGGGCWSPSRCWLLIGLSALVASRWRRRRAGLETPPYQPEQRRGRRLRRRTGAAAGGTTNRRRRRAFARRAGTSARMTGPRLAVSWRAWAALRRRGRGVGPLRRRASAPKTKTPTRWTPTPIPVVSEAALTRGRLRARPAMARPGTPRPTSKAATRRTTIWRPRSRVPTPKPRTPATRKPSTRWRARRSPRRWGTPPPA